MRASLMTILFLFSSLSFSAEVLSGKRVKRFLARDYAMVKVQYGGGCAKHLFSLQLRDCDHKNKVCEFKLMHDSAGDRCEMYVEKTLRLRVPKGKKIRRYDWRILGENKTSIKIEKN